MALSDLIRNVRERITSAGVWVVRLAGSAPTWGTIVGVTLVPLVIVLTSGMVACGWEWIFEPLHPVVLTPGDGLALRTQVAMPATQTWLYGYTAHWFEK